MTDRQLYAELGRRLHAIRRAQKVTQAQLGARIGTSGYIIHNAEQYGAIHLRQERFEQIATALCVEPWKVLADEWRALCGID